MWLMLKCGVLTSANCVVIYIFVCVYIPGYRGRRRDSSLLQCLCHSGRRRGDGQQSLERPEETH